MYFSLIKLKLILHLISRRLCRETEVLSQVGFILYITVNVSLNILQLLLPVLNSLFKARQLILRVASYY